MTHISVVIPVYKAEDCLGELYKRLVASLESITSDFEIILVEDCGGDRSWEIIKELINRDNRIRGMQFSRNFGQHNGITAGMNHSRGEWVVVMDCDLQEPPEEIPRLYQKAHEGYDVVVGRRTIRRDNFFKDITSKIFYKIFNYLTESDTDPSIGNLRIMSRKVVDSFNNMHEHLRYFGGMIQWMGFKTVYLDVEHRERYAGESSYDLGKLVQLAFNCMVSFSDKPLKLSIKFGFFMFVTSFLYGCFLIYKKLAWGVEIQGWTSVMVSIYLIGGLIFLNLGVLGFYIGRIFDETRKRPLYIIREIQNFEKSAEQITGGK